MQLVLLLLLLPQIPHAQVTPSVFTGTGTAEAINRTNSLFNATGTPESPSSSEPTEIVPTPSEAPEDDWSPAETYLASGDPSALALGECSRSYSPPELSGPLPESFYAPLQPAMNALANTANFLNMVFQASDLRESTVREDIDWYHALVRALLEADLLIGHALLTFDADPASQVPQLVLRASRNLAPKVQGILLQDLSRAWKSLHPPAPAPDDSWFSGFKSNEPMAALSKRLLLNDLTTLDTPKWGQGDSYVTNRSGVRWANAPFLECKDGRFLPRWMLTLSTSFYGLKPDLTPEFRGVIRVDVSVQDFDVDQCATGPGWFTNTHQCNRTSMECVPRPDGGFRLGQYCCRCKMGYYSPPVDTGANGTGSGDVCYPLMPVCLPCWPGCKSCEDGSPCLVQQNRFLRVWMMVIQGFFMILVFLSMLAAYQHRQSKRIRASGLLLLETILFGALLLYFPVFILYFKPSTFRCILLRWMRMLGFSIVYGTVTLKLYRVLRVFLSRTAQRVPYLSSIHLLRMLGVMLVTVVWFLCAWTVCVLQNRERNIPVFVTSTTWDGQGFLSCYMDRWDDMMAVAELLLLCWGSSLCNAVKPVPSAFHEPRYMGFAVHNELLLSSMFHLLRFFLPSLHPDWTLLLFFTHTHVTITVTLALLFVPKFLHVSRPKREEIAAEVYEDEVDLRRSGSYFNSSFCSAYSDHSVDPDDIRDELKKLYSQLEVNKTKKMTSNNPHLSKKRSSRCLSIIKSLAAPLSRQCSTREEKSRRSSLCPDSRRGSAISINVRDTSSIVHNSQSDHDHVVERKPSLRDSMLKAMTKRNSQRSMTDSLDIPPGVPKSLSAQNLTIDNNLLHPDQCKLQKSLSLKSTHSLVDIPLPPPKVDTPKVDRAKSMPEANIKAQTAGAIQASQSTEKAEICPWEMEDASSQGEDAKPVDLGAQLICPWEYIPPPPPPKPVEEAPPPQVSASAPVSPMPKIGLAKARGLSLKTTTQKWLSVKAFTGGSLDTKPKEKPKDGDSISQKSRESETRERTASIASSTSPMPSRVPSVERRYLQRKSITSIDGKPCLVKQNAIRLSSTDSDKSPRPRLPSRQNSNHSGASRTPSTNRPGSVSNSQVCPWDAPQSDPSGKANICPWEVQETQERAGVCPWESQDINTVKRQDSGRADVCPWDSQDVPATSAMPVSQEVQQRKQSLHDVSKELQQRKQSLHDISKELQQRKPSLHDLSKELQQRKPSLHDLSKELQQRKPSLHDLSKELQQRKQSLHAAADVCPWESAEATQLSVRQNTNTNVCPWEVEGSEAIYQNVNPLGTKGPQMAHLRQGTVQSSVSTQQPDKSAESCPWEFPEPPTIVTDVCPWEEAEPSIESTPHGSTTIKVDICPWDTLSAPSADNDSPRLNICPWDTEQPDKSVAPQIVSIALGKTKGQDSGVKADVCPWESGEPGPEKMSLSRSTDTIRMQDVAKADVCPWESGEPETMSASRSTDTIRVQDSAKADVCPWESGEPETMSASRSTDTIRMQDSAKADVCPWEAAEPETIKKPDVCPWESAEPEPVKMSASRSTDTIRMQDTAKGDVCPWEAAEPETVKKPDVCPWEVDESKAALVQHGARDEACPWETAEPTSLKKPGGAPASVCPWEAEEPTTLNQGGAKGDVCPWETEETTGLKKPGGALASVCPWEAEEPTTLKMQDGTSPGSKANVCPWEAEPAPNPTESQADVPNGGKAEVTGNLQQRLSTEEVPVEGTVPQHEEESNGNLPLGRRDALCPWGIERSRSGSFTDTSDVFTWEPENIPEEEEDDADAECAAEACFFPADL